MFIFRSQSLFVGARRGGGYYGYYLVLKTNEMRCFLGGRNLPQERLLESLPFPLSPFCVFKSVVLPYACSGLNLELLPLMGPLFYPGWYLNAHGAVVE